MARLSRHFSRNLSILRRTIVRPLLHDFQTQQVIFYLFKKFLILLTIFQIVDKALKMKFIAHLNLILSKLQPKYVFLVQRNKQARLSFYRLSLLTRGRFLDGAEISLNSSFYFTYITPICIRQWLSSISFPLSLYRIGIWNLVVKKLIKSFKLILT